MYNNNMYNPTIPLYQGQQIPTYQSQQYNTSNIINNQNVKWIPVNGIEGARNHIVQPNQTAWLMDNNDMKFYVKSADYLGVTTLKAYQFTEINSDNPVNDNRDFTEFVKRDELDKIIETKLNNLADTLLLEKGGKK